MTPSIASGLNSATLSSVSWIGSIAPFWTKLPIQSCAPSTRSGALPAWWAVTYWVCSSSAMVSTLTSTPFSSANRAPISSTAGVRSASTQIVRPGPPATSSSSDVVSVVGAVSKCGRG